MWQNNTRQTEACFGQGPCGYRCYGLSFKRPGEDIGGAVIAYGGGVEARTGLAMGADIYAFSRNQGLYAGGVIEGSVISEQPDWNQAYYGVGATAAAILQNRFYNPHADQLRAALPN